MSDDEKRKTTKAYRLFGQQKEKVDALFKQSGIELEGDFLDHMASVYEMNQLKTGVGAGYQKQISTLEYHAKSIIDSFVALVQVESAERLQIAENYEGKLGDRAAEITAQQQEIIELKETIRNKEKADAELSKKISEQTQLIEALQKSAAKDEQILVENKERIERLSQMLADSAERVGRAEELERQFAELTRINEEQARQLAKDAAEREEAEGKFREELTRMETDHTVRLRAATERAEVAQEKAVLAAQREFNEIIDKERREYKEHNEMRDKERREYHEVLAKERQEHTQEIRHLYAEIDKLREQLAETQKRE